MNTIKYKHVRLEWNLGTQFSKDKFDKTMIAMLTEHGNAGWDLKGIIHEGGLHAHFIFGRESEPSASRETSLTSSQGSSA